MSELLLLREIIEDAGFELQLVSGERFLGRAVRGVLLSDLDDPTPWMTPGLLLITTGRPFADDLAVGERLIERLAEAGTTAFGMGQEHYFQEIPRRLVEKAEACGLPTFLVPARVRFKDIAGYVHDALASHDLHLLRRRIALESRLLDALLAGHTVSEALTPLADLVGVPLALFDSSGEVLASGGAVTAELLSSMWQGFLYRSTQESAIEVLELGVERLRYREISLGGHMERVLVAAERITTPVELIDECLDQLQKQAELELLRLGEEVALRRRLREALFRDLISGQRPPSELAIRLKEVGLDAGAHWWMLAIGVDWRAADGAEVLHGTARIIDLAEVFFTSRSVPALVGINGTRVTALVVVDDDDMEDARELASSLRELLGGKMPHVGISLGVSRTADDMMDAPLRAREAADALAFADEVSGKRLIFCDDLEQQYHYVMGTDRRGLEGVYKRLWMPLREYDEQHHSSLERTLVTYLDNRLSTQRTAEVLIVHPNTVLQRLRRIEYLIGISLASVDDLAALQLARRGGEYYGF